MESPQGWVVAGAFWLCGNTGNKALYSCSTNTKRGFKGEKSIKEGEFTITEPIAVLNTKDGDVEVTMLQKWPVRKKRPYVTKMAPREAMVTGQRVIDTLFPIASGGIAAIPGPFGSGKTVVQHQLAKWADAD